jgi:hypothetical protein
MTIGPKGNVRLNDTFHGVDAFKESENEESKNKQLHLSFVFLFFHLFLIGKDPQRCSRNKATLYFTRPYQINYGSTFSLGHLESYTSLANKNQ